MNVSEAVRECKQPVKNESSAYADNSDIIKISALFRLDVYSENRRNGNEYHERHNIDDISLDNAAETEVLPRNEKSHTDRKNVVGVALKHSRALAALRILLFKAHRQQQEAKGDEGQSEYRYRKINVSI